MEGVLGSGGAGSHELPVFFRSPMVEASYLLDHCTDPTFTRPRLFSSLFEAGVEPATLCFKADALPTELL